MYILHLEDNPLDAELVRVRLEEEGIACDVRRVESHDEYLAAIKKGDISIILSDWQLPTMNGGEALTIAHEQLPDVPFIFVSGALGEERAIEMFKNGATDYVLKDRLSRLAPAVRRAMKEAEESEKRRKAEDALRQSEERFRLLVEGVQDYAIFMIDPDGRIVSWNEGARRIEGYEADEVVGQDCRRFYLGEDIKNGAADEELRTAREAGRCEAEGWRIRKDASKFWANVVTTALRDTSGTLRGFSRVTRDMTERKQTEDTLRLLASSDRLTGLPNRTAFHERITAALAEKHRDPNQKFAVLFIDFDRFKIINDSLGHKIGDKLLVEIANRLQIYLRGMKPSNGRRHDHVAARHGGDEFLVLLDGIKKIQDAEAVARRLQQDLSQPYLLDGNEVHTSPSIGITTSDLPYEKADDLIRDADTAMYRAKEGGRADCVVFDKKMHEAVAVRHELENELRRAIEQDQLVLHYHPLVFLATGALSGFEALVRWQHPERGLIPPDEFIPIAEETGLIHSLGSWVVRAACQQLGQWRRKFGKNCIQRINVNVSRKQIDQQLGLVQTIEAATREAGIEPCALHVEITETAIMRNMQTSSAVLQNLESLGVKLEMDDFGTGYSSLSCLHRFPLAGIKIDRSFVTNMAQWPDYLAVVRTIVSLAHSLDVKVTAEGVSTDRQYTQLQMFRCDTGQGSFFGKPMPVAAAEKYLTNQTALACAA